jgi:hypothetical protein
MDEQINRTTDQSMESTKYCVATVASLSRIKRKRIWNQQCDARIKKKNLRAASTGRSVSVWVWCDTETVPTRDKEVSTRLFGGLYYSERWTERNVGRFVRSFVGEERGSETAVAANFRLTASLGGNPIFSHTSAIRTNSGMKTLDD